MNVVVLFSCSYQMDLIDLLEVRFHFRGKFLNDGRKVEYVGGFEAISFIDRDKVSLPEVEGHLKDHCNLEEGSLLHWLFPGKDLSNGLRVLDGDAVEGARALMNSAPEH